MKVRQADWYKNTWKLGVKELSWVEETEQQVSFIIERLRLTGNERILDLACGFGRHSLSFAQKGFDVVGVDITEPYINDAIVSAKQLGVRNEFICADIRDLHYENEFDVVLNMADGAIGYLETDAENEKIFDVICNSLKPGGKSLIDIVNAEYAARHFPMKHWEAGEHSLSLADFEWDQETKRMLYGGRSYKYGEPVQRPDYEADPIRLYTKQEITEMLKARGMSVIDSFSDYTGNRDSDKHMQLILYSEKTN